MGRRFRLLAEALPGPLLLTGAEGRLADWNTALARLCGPAAAAGVPLDALALALQPDDLAPGARQQAARRLAERLSGPEPAEFDVEMQQTRLHVYKPPSGPEGMLAFGLELERLRALIGAPSAARHQAMLDLVPAGLWEIDSQGRTRMGNAALLALFGGRLPDSLAEAGLRAAETGQPLRLPLPEGQASLQVELPLPEAPPRRLLLTASAPLPPQGGADALSTRLISLLDITEQHRAELAATHLSRHDALTGLKNPQHFQELLEEALGRGQPLVLLSIDISGAIAEVNDRHGHALGDAALRAAAQRLRQVVRVEDRVFRTSGSKFSVLALERDAAAGLAMAQRIDEALRPGLRLSTLDLQLDPAIGLACAPALRDPEALRRAVDLARQESRNQGTGPVLYTPELGQAALLRYRLRQILPEALHRNELRLVWQPQRDLRDRRLIGAEALLRWNSSALGREVSPAELLPAATEAGLLPEIDAWVLDTALATKRRWAGLPGAPPTIAINISLAGLKDPDFARQVGRGLLRHDLRAQELEIEISEDLPARDLDALAPTLRGLASLGVRLALDDFGAGASSLAHLVRLPVNRVKLDRSIIAALPGGSAEGAILRAAIALARSLDIEVLAEGVETEIQAAALRREGCHAVQGWLYGRPEEADVLVAPLGRAAL